MSDTRRKFTGTTLTGLAVLIPGLAISAWSLYGYLRNASAPIWLSVGASASIDGLGMFAAAKAHSFAASGRPSRFPRLITYTMVFASIYVNWAHADTAGWPMGIHVLVAVPAAAAAAGFEIIMEETRADYRERAETRKRTRRLSKIDAILYLRHPIEVWQLRQDEAGDALDAIMLDSPRRAARLSGRRTARQLPSAASPDTAGQTLSEPVRELAPLDPAEAVSGTVLTFPVGHADTPTGSGWSAQSADAYASAATSFGSRTSDPDTTDMDSRITAELARHAASLDTEPMRQSEPQHSPGSITEAVRRVYTDSADTQTITRIVAQMIPDAKPDTVARAVRRVRTERSGKPGHSEPGTGQYL